MGAKGNSGDNDPTIAPGVESRGPAPVCASQPVRVATGTDPTVVDNLPADISITARELEVLETYLADLTDQLIGDALAGDGSALK